MYYSDEVVEEVRAGNDIVDVIGSYIRLQKKGANYMGLCPFHGEKTPSFSVSGSRQMYHCFGCGTGGNVFTFLMEYENFTFPEAVKQLADRAGIKLPEEEVTPEARKRADRRMRLLDINKEAAKFYYVRLKNDAGKAAYNYFKRRGLSDETITRFGLGYSDKSGGLYQYLKSKGYEDELLKDSGLFTFDEKKGVYDKFWNRAMFPIMDGNSRVIGFGGRVLGEGEPKYLNSPETVIFDKSRNLYALNYARQSRESYFLLCEGYMDVISLHQAGFANAVASLGTAFTGLQANLIARYVKEVYITYDSDGAGQKAALRAIPILRAAGLSAKVVDMRPYKDPDEFIKALGAEEYRRRLQAARNSFYFEIDTLKQEYDFSDPEQKTRFFRETAKKLLQFSDELERRTYTEAVAKEYQIGFAMLNRLVEQYGSAAMPGEERKETEYKERKRNKPEEGYYTSQKLLLTWLTTEPVLFQKVKGIVTPEDFTDGFYYEAAKEVFEQYEKEGKVTPARILNRYETKEEQTKAAELFQTTLLGDLGETQKAKAFAETVRKVRQNSIEMRMGRAAETGDIEAMQKAVTEQASLDRALAKAGL